jgi:hypothetical protein
MVIFGIIMTSISTITNLVTTVFAILAYKAIKDKPPD